MAWHGLHGVRTSMGARPRQDAPLGKIPSQLRHEQRRTELSLGDDIRQEQQQCVMMVMVRRRRALTEMVSRLQQSTLQHQYEPGNDFYRTNHSIRSDSIQEK